MSGSASPDWMWIIEKTTVHQNPWTKLEKEYEDKRGVADDDIKTANATMAVKTNTEKKMEEEEEKKKSFEEEFGLPFDE